MQIRSGPFFAAGSSTSDVLSLGQLDPLMIIAPANWKNANLQFLYSPDNANFYPLHLEGRRWEVLCEPNTVIKLELHGWPTYSFFKFVSCTGGNPVVQPEDCWFQMLGN